MRTLARPSAPPFAFALAVSWALATLTAGPLAREARAQRVRGPADESPSLEASVRAGQARAALRRSDVDEAVRLFREAVRLGASPLVLRELAPLLEQQGALRAAAEAWQRYSTLAPDPAARENARVRGEQLRARPSLLRVRVLPHLAAREARVWFDHEPPRFVPTGGAESTVEGGPHRVRVESPGYAPFETMVTTAFGEPLDVRAVLQPALGSSPGGDRAPPPAPPPTAR